MTKPNALFAFLAGASVILLATSTEAGQRRFAFNYEAESSPAGYLSYEQWITWGARSEENHDLNEFKFRHEVEWAPSDRLMLGFYLADWKLTSGTDDDGAEFEHAGVEAIWTVCDASKDPFGFGLYGETLLGPDEFELEGKLLFQKNIGPLALVYNFILEAKWEGDGYDEEAGEIGNTIGLSYQVKPNFFIGAEAVHEVELEDWSESGENVVWVGPNFSWRSGNFFATLAPLFQVTDVAEEPDFQTRLIFGIKF